MMRDDFCVFILTHGRVGRIHTYDYLEKCGYTGKIYFIVDDEDEALPDYIKDYGDKVLTFSKAEAAKTFDEGDNFNDRRAVVYARNVCFDMAKKVGCRFFFELDDDYTTFSYRFDDKYNYKPKAIKSLDDVLSAMVEYLEATPFLSIAMGQGGDYIGGQGNRSVQAIKTSRKVMNTFVCDTKKPFKFVGRINEDTTTYVTLQRAYGPFLTILGLSINQFQTQSNDGGLTDIYLAMGTYVKSFYSVMYAPSCVKVVDMGRNDRRIHHRVSWDAAAPKIIHESLRKPRPEKK